MIPAAAVVGETPDLGTLVFYFFYFYSVALPAKPNVAIYTETGEIREVNNHANLWQVINTEGREVTGLLRNDKSAEVLINKMREAYNSLASSGSLKSIV